MRGNLIVVLTLSLILVAIAAYGGEYVWQEGTVFAAVFLLTTAIVIATRSEEPIRSIPRRLLFPLLLLSAYSFLQGLLTLALAGTTFTYQDLIPYGLDAMASIWSGVKILAFICLLGLSAISLKINRNVFIVGLITIGSLFAVFGIARLLLQDLAPSLNHYIFAYELRPNVGFGTFLNQNHFALLMLMTFGLSIGLLLMGRLTRAKKAALAAAILISWIALVLTASRAGIVGSFFVVLTMIAFHLAAKLARNQNTRMVRGKAYGSIGKSLIASVIVIIALIAGVILVGQDQVVHRFAELPEQMEGTVGSAFRRADVWDATIEMIGEHFLFGVGFGGFRYGVPQYIEISGDVVPKQAHNDYLELFVSGGIIAGGLFAWFLYALYSEIRTAYRNSRVTEVMAARVGAVCGIVGVAFHSSADFGLQYAGNASFLAALIAISVFQPDYRNAVNSAELQRPLRPAKLAALTVLGVTLFAFCVTLGLSRYLLSVAAANEKADIQFGLRFDAEYFSLSAEHFVKKGNIEQAAEALRSGVLLRSQDYELWLRLAQLEARQGNYAEADETYRSAISLAPLFGEPHFFYGAFLLQTRRTDEAVRELSFAARRDDRYTEAVLETIWDKTALLPDILVDLAMSGRYKTKETVTRLLLAKQEFDLLGSISCRADFSDLERDMLVRQLLERRKYRVAWRIFSQCQNDDSTAMFVDGDFEQLEFKKGFGFGWRLGDAIKRSNVAVDGEDPADGRQSLRFTFDGEVPSIFLKQVIPVRQDTRYDVSFSYRSHEIISGGVPLVQIVIQQSDGSSRVTEVELGTENTHWNRRTLSFQTDEGTEGVEVILTKRPCGQSRCPIFGDLWVDGFVIRRHGRNESP